MLMASPTIVTARTASEGRADEVDRRHPSPVDPVRESPAGDAEQEHRQVLGSATAIETRNGSRVWRATSSGPAASATPSPMLVMTD